MAHSNIRPRLRYRYFWQSIGRTFPTKYSGKPVFLCRHGKNLRNVMQQWLNFRSGVATRSVWLNPSWADNSSDDDRCTFHVLRDRVRLGEGRGFSRGWTLSPPGPLLLLSLPPYCLFLFTVTGHRWGGGGQQQHGIKNNVQLYENKTIRSPRSLILYSSFGL